MATSDKIDSIHENIGIMSSVGSISAALSMSFYFMAYEWNDPHRLNLGGSSLINIFRKGNDNSKYDSSKSNSNYFNIWKKNFQYLFFLFYLLSVTVIVLSVSLYRHEREHQADNIPSLLQQLRNSHAEPDVNEVAILSGISGFFTVLGIFLALRKFEKEENLGMTGPLLHAVGWLGQAFAASMNSKSIQTLKLKRLAWCLPGVALINTGFIMYPWQIKNDYSSGPAGIISLLGYLLFSYGNTLVLHPPQLED
jgi:hypothetical protein